MHIVGHLTPWKALDKRERERGRDIAILDFVQFDLTHTHAVIYFYLRIKTDYLEVKQRNDSGRVARQNM